MSRQRESTAICRNSTMVLPNIPRLTDDKSKIKYMTEYDKYEPELLKHHLGNGENTHTIGLKDVPPTFSRTVPSLNEPMPVDVEYELRLSMRNSKKTHRNHLAATAGRKVKTAADDKGRSGSSATAAVTAALSTRQQSVIGELPAEDGQHAEAKAAAHSSRPFVVVATPHSDVHPEPVLASRSTAAVRYTSATRSTSTSKSPVRERSMPRKPTEENYNSSAGLKPHPNLSSPRRPVMSATAPAASAVSQSAPASSRIGSDDIEQALLADRSALQCTALSLKPASLKNELHNVESVAELLRILVNTPPEFSESFHLNVDKMDLGWLTSGRHPSLMVTLVTWRAEGEGTAVQCINSPRSVLVMLRNGVSVHDLVPCPPQDNDCTLSQNPAVREAVKKYRVEHDVARREVLRDALVQEYKDMCSSIPLPDLLLAFREPPHPREEAEMPTSLQRWSERQQKMMLMNKIRYEKQLTLIKEVHTRKLNAEERRAQAEAEALVVAEEKAREAEANRAKHMERLEVQRRKNQQMAAAYQAQLAERLQKAEKHSQERQKAQERLAKARREKRSTMALERQKRFERNAELQRRKEAEVEAKRLKKEEELEELITQRRQRLEEERHLLEEKQLHAAKARQEAMQRAQEAAEDVRRAAIAKQQLVEERVQKFLKEREEAVHQRMAEQELRAKKRQEAFAEALAKVEHFREETLHKQEAHELNFEECQLQRLISHTVRAEREREVMVAKSFAVKQKQRVSEFHKLNVIADLLKKRSMADFVTRQRERIVKQSLADRDFLTSERETLRREL